MKIRQARKILKELGKRPIPERWGLNVQHKAYRVFEHHRFRGKKICVRDLILEVSQPWRRCNILDANGKFICDAIVDYRTFMKFSQDNELQTRTKRAGYIY